MSSGADIKKLSVSYLLGFSLVDFGACGQNHLRRQCAIKTTDAGVILLFVSGGLFGSPAVQNSCLFSVPCCTRRPVEQKSRPLKLSSTCNWPIRHTLHSLNDKLGSKTWLAASSKAAIVGSGSVFEAVQSLNWV